MKTLQDAIREVAPALGYKIAEASTKEVRPKKCRVCGGDMIAITGTNVWVCQNMVEKTKSRKNEDGSVTEYKVTEMCDNRLLTFSR